MHDLTHSNLIQGDEMVPKVNLGLTQDVDDEFFHVTCHIEQGL